MSGTNNISEELENMGSFLADLSRTMPYHVPDEKKEKFELDLKEAINYIEEPESNVKWGKTPPYAVPNDYFKNFPDIVLKDAILEDKASGFSKAMPFQIPDGYFESFAATLPGKIKVLANSTEKRRIVLRPHVILQVRWAAAAILLICVSLGSYITFFSPSSQNPDRMLASVSNNDIQAYFQHTYPFYAPHVMNSNTVSNIQVDNKDIIEYFNENGWD